jgi:hypothetical protein
MPVRHVVVDGSNIATEGGSIPSLKQLDEAVREFIIENPGDVVTVVVDASFGHRIDPSEREDFERAETAGEIVLPPAGAIGRGDAFLLRIADKVGAVVLSNDSFQEFHGEYEWLFDEGRLVGGKPVPGIGWIFTPRAPVRGVKSRESVKEAKRKKRSLAVDETEGSGLDMAAERLRGRGGERKLQRAIAVAAEEAVEPAKHGRKQRRQRHRHRAGVPPSEPLNEPLNFITFIASTHLGDKVEGTVEEFTSHGAFVSVDGARCYVPLSAMGEPAPRSAREVLRRGEIRQFVVQAFDAIRRGIELALPGFARISGSPTDETVDAEIHRPAVLGAGAGAPGAAPTAVGTFPANGAVTRKGRPARKTAAAAVAAEGDGSPVAARGVTKAKVAGITETAPKVAATAEVAANKAKAPAAKAITATAKELLPTAAGNGLAAKPRAVKAPATKAKAATIADAPAARVPASRMSAARGRAAKAPAGQGSAVKPTVASPGTPAVRAKAAPAKARSAKGAAPKAPTKTPATKTPATKAPVTRASVAKAPATRAPVAKASATRAPATRAPATRAPATRAPATRAPEAKPKTPVAKANAANAKAPVKARVVAKPGAAAKSGKLAGRTATAKTTRAAKSKPLPSKSRAAFPA